MEASGRGTPKHATQGRTQRSIKLPESRSVKRRYLFKELRSCHLRINNLLVEHSYKIFCSSRCDSLFHLWQKVIACERNLPEASMIDEYSGPVSRFRTRYTIPFVSFPGASSLGREETELGKPREIALKRVKQRLRQEMCSALSCAFTIVFGQMPTPHQFSTASP